MSSVAPTSTSQVRWSAFACDTELRLVLLVDYGCQRVAWDPDRIEALSLAHLILECVPELA